MRILAQRVKHASVSVEGAVVASIGVGLMALVAFGAGDGPLFRESRAFYGMARKLTELRIFPGEGELTHKFQTSLKEYGGSLLLVPQFTLYADCRKGRRPSFTAAGDPAWAADMFSDFARLVDEQCEVSVSSGIFGADMDVVLCNWGPVTVWLDSAELFPR
ncbi:MAG: D-tyrosyl-tRNA(Tyr) deacylase [Desulfovibrio desulfuricans]|jgi:D-tyrosyl-tRNA(Tyr) deacylase|nr:D-tyrosyl-tRNA(Tyr) deacylase [Desulfovibrio desulfuricans]